ncbi:ABC transporter substrate-binding protein [Brachybacterium sp. AOP25-B2-12]|uniref:ABC transporter substrate-binding protein n=1 Tax=Brachybacterium sp. AOP25-B2-12 TaxID=3457710 RepID=UPI0040348693
MSSSLSGRRAASFRRVAATAGKIVAATATVALLASCSSGGGGSDSGSDTLHIGAILPQTGSLSLLGPAAIAGSEVAIDDINDAKPKFEAKLTVKDSGDTTTDIASSSAKSLLSSNVSGIIAPESSAVVKTVFSQLTNAQVPFITPAATDPTLTHPNKSNGYFFRTVPTDVLQGQALAQKIVSDGRTKVSILYMNEAYGTGLNEQIKKTLEDNGVEVVADVPFTPNSTNFNAEVSDVLSPGPDALVVISFDEIKSIAAALQQNKFDFNNFYGTDGNNGILGAGDPDITGAQFSTPGVNPEDDFRKRLDTANGKALSSYSYAAESYDAVTLMALAAAQGGDTKPATIKDNLKKVSEGGTACTSFKECYALIEKGEDIDYNGQSGPISFNDDGDVSEASISFYKTVGPDNKTDWVEQQSSKL